MIRLGDVENENRVLQQEVRVLTKDNHRLNDLGDRLTKRIGALEQDNSRLNDNVNSVTQNVTSSSDPEPDTYSQFTAFSCTSGMVTLSCPGGRTILTVTANYGQYASPNSECTDCCSPNPLYDCTEVVEENRPSDWLAIQALCDGQESCEFENLGSAINECEQSYLSNYMQLFYDCLPDDRTGPVAFTAWANTGNPTSYNADDIIVFEQVLTNAGGHYNADTSSFICPWHGVYLVSVNIQGHDSDYINIHLKRNAVDIGYLVIDNISGAVNRGSTTIVIECDRGDILWVMAGYTGGIYTISAPLTLFTAHMIHRY